MKSLSVIFRNRYIAVPGYLRGTLISQLVKSDLSSSSIYHYFISRFNLQLFRTVFTPCTRLKMQNSIKIYWYIMDARSRRQIITGRY